MKPKEIVTIRIKPETRKKIERSAASKGKNGISTYVSDILEDFYNDKWERSIVEANFNTMGRIERLLKQITGDNEALFDFLSLFVFQWCCHLPDLNPKQRQVQALEGQKRYDEFLKLLKKMRIERKGFAALILEELRELYGPAKAA